VLVNKKPFITGFVEQINISYDSTGHQISISGRDKTCDIVDDTVGSDLSFSAGVSLPEIITKVLGSLGLDADIKVKNNVKDLAVFGVSDLGNISPQIGQTAFDFIEKYAKKRQVLIMSDGDGNIVLTRVPEEKDKIKTVLTSSAKKQSTILTASVTYNDVKRFYKYIMLSQQNPVSSATGGVVTNLAPYQQNGGNLGASEEEDNSSDSEIDNEKMISMKAISYDKDIRHTRIYNMMQHCDSENDSQSLQDKAEWEANYRRATGFNYTVTVQGFSPINDPKIIWQPNMLVTVKDEYCDIDSQLLLIKSVKFTYGIDSGSTTTLELIDKDGYSVDIMQGVKYKNKKKTAAGKNIDGGVVSDLTPYQKA
jgi:prophage tail gpP-like protein